MKIVKFSLFALVLALFAACGNSSSSNSEAGNQMTESQLRQQEEMWDKVMAVHDEVMPLMSQVNEYSRNLKSNLKDNKVPEEMKEKTQNTINRLEEADEAMFSWMANVRQLDPLRDSLSHGQILEYLEDEMVAVNKVKLKILGSIESGKALVNQLTEGKKEQ